MSKILIAEDEKSMRDLLALMLRKEGHGVETVEGGVPVSLAAPWICAKNAGGAGKLAAKGSVSQLSPGGNEPAPFWKVVVEIVPASNTTPSGSVWTPGSMTR